MPEPKRVARAAALDDISDHLGVVLKRADELLAEWSAFGATVRAQVEREAATIGDAVASSVDSAVARATAVGIDRAISDHVGARLNALTGELSRLEARARAASRSLSDERTGDRRILWIVAAGVLAANALLIAMLLRKAPAAAPPVAEPARVEYVTPPGAAPSEGTGSGGTDPTSKSAEPSTPAGGPTKPDAVTPAKVDPAAIKIDPAAKVDPAKVDPAKADPAATKPATPGKPGPAPVKATPGAQTKPAAHVTPTHLPADTANASVPGVRVPSAKLPPRRK